MSLPIRILHLTDFHWDAKHSKDQELIVRELKSDIRTITPDRKIDLVVFSGDLVNRGSSADDFASAKRALFDDLRDSFDLTDADFVICPGNHDVDREIAREQQYLEAGLKAELQNTNKLNEHIDRYISSRFAEDDSNRRLTHFNALTRSTYNLNAKSQSNYVDCVVRETRHGRVGIALFNTAWRSTGAGDVERYQLLLGERVVSKAADDLSECSIKIAVMHHPLDWLAPWDAKSSQIPLFINFDLVLFGHVHETMPTLTHNPIGECLLAQGGSLFAGREYYNGYQVIDISREDGLAIDVYMRSWFNAPRRGFGPAENICKGGQKQFRFAAGEPSSRKLQVTELLAVQAATDEMANNHLRTLQLRKTAAFDDSFTCPPLSYQTEDELRQLRPKAYKSSLIELSQFIDHRGTVVICGARESGKSTIALKIAKDILRSDGSSLRIPVYANFSTMKSYETLEKLARSHFNVLNLDISAKRVLSNHRCVFIVDNVSLADHQKIDRLHKLIKETNGIHDWIIFLDSFELLSRDKIEKEFGPVKPVFIQPFGRTEIRELVTKISSAPSHANNEVDTIIKLMNDNELPRNPYIVTLLSSVIGNLSADAAINEATLLDKLIDRLLNKQDPTNIIRSSTDFAGLNIFLEQIAKWLSEENGVLSENDLLSRLAQYLSERGIQEPASSLLAVFTSVGLLERLGDELAFRYRSFEAYFLARHAARNKTFIPKLLEDVAILTHSKVFSLLCDLSRKDSDLLEYLEVVVLELHPPLFEKADKASFIQSALAGSFENILDDRLGDIEGGPASVSQIDETHDFQDRARSALAAQMQRNDDVLKNDGPDEERLKPLLRAAGYLEAWRVWGRAISSLDFVELSVRKPSLVRLLDHWARLATVISEAGFNFLTDIAKQAEKDGKQFSPKMQYHLEYIARVGMPLSSARQVFSHIGSSSIHQLLIETFDELDLNTSEALGAACMLIRQKPAGWAGRVKRFIDARVIRGNKGIVQYFMLEALYQEYYQHQLSTQEVREVEDLLAHLLSHAGFVNQRKAAILHRIETNRPKVELLTRDIRR